MTSQFNFIPADVARKQISKWGGDRKSEKRNQDYHNNVDRQGTDSEYLQARLARDIQLAKEVEAVKKNGGDRKSDKWNQSYSGNTERQRENSLDYQAGRLTRGKVEPVTLLGGN